MKTSNCTSRTPAAGARRGRLVCTCLAAVVLPLLAWGQDQYLFTTLAGRASIGWQDGTGANAQFNDPEGVATDSAGNIYVADTANHAIRMVTPAGVVTTIAGTPGWPGSADGPALQAQFNHPRGIKIDGAGNIYVADTSNHTIRKITAGVVSTLAGTAGQTGTTDAVGADARFNQPYYLTLDASANIYVADTFNHTIRMVSPAGAVTTFAGTAGVAGSANGTGTAAQFRYPQGVVVDSSGNIFVADSSNRLLRKITPAGVVTTFAGGAAGYGDGVGTGAGLGSICGITVDGSDNLYVVDHTYAVRMVTPGAVVTTLAGLPPQSGYLDGIGTAARFNGPVDIAINAAGNLYVVEIRNNLVRKIAPGAVVTTLAGTPPSTGSADGVGAAARFNSPWDVARDGAGNLFIADGGNHTIRQMTPEGVVSTFAGTAGVAGYLDATGTAAQFNNPVGLALDAAGNLFVADSGNQVIRKITPAGTVSTFAGAFGVGMDVDGDLSAARFVSPYGLAFDGAGNLYVAEGGLPGGKIRKITTAGQVTTLAGGMGFGVSVDGTGSGAGFYNPWDLVVDASGNIYVAERSVGKLRKVTPAGVTSTLFAGSPYALGVALDASGRVCFTCNSAVMRYDPTDGTVVTLGGLPGSTGSADGVGSSARFYWSAGIAIDGTGNLYVADEGNNTIRKGSVAIAPAITAQPASQTVNAGATATFTVTATGSPTYQWSLNGIALVDGPQADGSTVSGATSATLTITGTTGAESDGTYTVTLTYGSGSVTSSAAVLSLRPSAAGASTFTGVGDLPGGAFCSVVRAATEDGQIAAGSGSVLNTIPIFGGSGDRPFLWTSTAGIKELPEPVTITAGTLFLTCSDITPDGAVIAGRVRTSPTANLRAAAIWTNDGKTLTVIPEIAGYSGGRSAANCISSDGKVVYGWSTDSATGKWQAFRWTAATGTVGLGFLNASDTQSVPSNRGVSADGSVMVGNDTASDGTTTAFIYTVGGGMRSLGYLPGGTWSWALAPSPDGATVLGAGDSTNYPGGEYFIWTQAGGLVPLGVGDPNDVENFGGTSTDSQVVAAGHYIHNGNGFMELTQIFANANLPITGWSQFCIAGMSRNANVLFGYATDPSGNYEGWVATLPSGYLQSLSLPAAITDEPVNQTAIAGSGAIFGAGVSGGPGLSVQWYLNGVALADGTQADGSTVLGSATPSLQLGNLPLARSGGSYTVRVSNNLGQATSPAAVLTVTPPAVVSVLVSGDPKLAAPLNLANDGTYLYVAGTNAATADPNRSSTGLSIFRVPLTGGTAVSLYPALNPQQLAVVGGNLDWIDPTSGSGTTQILQAPAAGGGIVAAIYSQPANPVIAWGEGLATDGTSLYASDADQGLVFRLNADGTGLTQLGGARYVTGEQNAAIAVSQGVIYILDSGESSGVPALVSLPANGSSSTYTMVWEPDVPGASNQTNALIVFFADPTGIAVGNGMIYVSDPGADNTIWAMPISGGNPVALVSGAPFSQLAGLTFANGVLYAADTGNNTIYRILLSGPATAPAITTQPQSQTVNAGAAATFTVTATGNPAVTYQWAFNGTALTDGNGISGSATATLSVTNVQAANAGSYTVVVSNGTGSVTSAAAQLTVLLVAITSISPAEVQAGGGSFTLTVTGSGFVNGATVLWNGAARPTTFVSPTQLTATIPAADIATVTDLQTVPITVKNPAGNISNVQPLTIVSAAVTAVQAGSAGEGAQVTVSVPPAAPSGGGVTATLTNATAGSGPATVAVATYGSQPVLNPNNPNPLYFFRIEAGYYDVQIAGVDSTDSVTSYFYWPSAITPATEGDPGFILYYFDGTTFSPVKSSGGAAPAKNTTDDLDGTISGGRFTVVFDTTSTPRLSDLTGKVFAIGIKDTRVPATVTLGGLTQTYDGAPEPATATTVPAGLAVTLTYNGSTTAPTNVGSYVVIGTIVDPNYRGTATGTLTIHKAAAVVTLGNLRQSYDGNPKPVTVTTTPLGLVVTLAYNGGATPPVVPGSYAVVAVVNDPNYVGSAAATLTITVTALVRHAPTLNGSIDGSIQVLSGENFTLNGNMYISGDLLVPGTPTVRLNGHASCGGTLNGSGSALPSGYVITLNGNVIVHRLVQHTDPITLPVVNAPPQPAGTRNVSLNSAGQSAGDFTTVRNLTLNGNVGQVAVPPGTYGTFTANGNSGFVLGVAGGTAPAVYNLQGLTLNGNSQLQVVGPVILTLAGSATFNGAVGSSAHLDWLTLDVYSGGVTLNGNVTFSGWVVAPAGVVTINGNSTLNGGVTGDSLTINGNGLVSEEAQ